MILQGDCLELMKGIEPGSIDLICTDLPYGTIDLTWDSIINLSSMWQEVRRVLKPKGAFITTSNQPFTTTLICSNPDWFKYSLIWVKSKSGGIFNAKNRPLKNHEEILIFSSGTIANKSPNRMTYNPQGIIRVTGSGVRKNSETDRAVFNPKPSHKETYTQEFTNYPKSVLEFKNEGKTSHPTQKPVTLMEYLIKTYSNEGETVLDITAGSGTTGVAAMNTNRAFILMEKDPGYYQIACKRLQEHENSLLLKQA